MCLKRAIVCLSCYTTHQDQKTWSLKFSLVCCVNLAHFLPPLVPGSFVGLCPRTWDPGNEFDCLMKKRKKNKTKKKNKKKKQPLMSFLLFTGTRWWWSCWSPGTSGSCGAHFLLYLHVLSIMSCF